MQNSKTVPQTLLGETAHFGFCPPKIGFLGGLGGSPNFFPIGIFIFLLIRSPCKLSKLQHKPFQVKQPILAFPAQKRLFQGGREGPRNLIFIGILLFLLLRSPCKKLKSYDEPLQGFEQRYQERLIYQKQWPTARFDETVCTAPLGPKQWPPSFVPAATGSARTLLDQKFPLNVVEN